jgi:anti-sigma regulatory factor (Ser/Thr protein kinase)
VTPNFRAAFSGERRNVPLARNAIASFARICGFSRDDIDDIKVAAGEALCNAVEHGQAHRSNGFSVSCSLQDDELRIEIRDNGEGFAPERLRASTPEADRGFGILLMRRLMDGVQFADNGTCVRLYRRRAL